MTRVFKTRYFRRWAEKAGLTDTAICKAVEEMVDGLIDADLGGGLVKKRVALPGQGKSRSVRTIVATNKGDRWFFVYGFEKNVTGNISKKDLSKLKEGAGDWLGYTSKQLDAFVKAKLLWEVIP
jgi:hypothetical protein